MNCPGDSKLGNLILLVVALLSIAAGTSATTMEKFSAAKLTSRAAIVVIGRVNQLDYQNVNGRAWTIVTIHVEQSLKGAAMNTIRFRLPGGHQSVDGRILVTKVDGVPEMRLREKGIFFLETAPPAFSGLLGWEQGFYRVLEKNGQEYAIRSDGMEAPQKLQPFLMNLRALDK